MPLERPQHHLPIRRHYPVANFGKIQLNLESRMPVTPTQNQICLLDMSRLGIQTAVFAEHAELDQLKQMFSTRPDKYFLQGKGKLAMRAHLKKNLETLDRFFIEHPDKLDDTNQIWTNFCTDCAIYAVLCSFFDKTPVGLVHPDDYSTSDPSWSHAKGNGDIKPSLIDGIPREQ